MGYAQALTYAARADRQVQVMKVLHGAAAGGIIAARSGVILGSASNFDSVRNASAGMQVDVDAGMAMVENYSVICPAKVTVTCAASTASARRDLIVLRVYDVEAGDASNQAKVEVVKGTTTSDPTVPARALILAQADIGANASQVTVTDRRTFTAAAGGVIPTRTLAGITASELAPGGITFDLATGTNYQRQGNSLNLLVPAPPAAVVELSQLSSIRMTTNAVPSSTWGSMASASGAMQSGMYLVIANCHWAAGGSSGQDVYTWLDLLCNGTGINPMNQAYGARQVGNNSNNTVLMNTVRHNGGNMTIESRFGFADRDIYAVMGSSIAAIRVAP